MKTNDLIPGINKILSDEFEVPADDILPEETIIDTLSLDSLGILDMIILLEKNFHVKFVTSEITELISFGDLYALIESKLDKEPAPSMASGIGI